MHYVDSLPNNQLWERAHDPTYGTIVRVNISHRVYTAIISQIKNNPQLVKVLDLLFHGLATGEYQTLYKSQENENIVEAVLDEYRERVGEALSNTVRTLDVADIVS